MYARDALGAFPIRNGAEPLNGGEEVGGTYSREVIPGTPRELEAIRELDEGSRRVAPDPRAPTRAPGPRAPAPDPEGFVPELPYRGAFGPSPLVLVGGALLAFLLLRR